METNPATQVVDEEVEPLFGHPTIEDSGVYTHLQGTLEEAGGLEKVFRDAGIRVFVLEV
jgi:hypothetical protein